MQARMRSRQSAPDVQFPRFSNRRTNMLPQSSIWCSHLLCFGVERTRRRWLASRKNAARVGLDGQSPLCSCSPRAALRSPAWATSLTTAAAFGVLR